ncbi:MAG: hypothetical protein HY235_28670 [Acidobacteria bacterium]|nr:hypothetical protein [Acidobacteriota bacterium]
MKGGSLGRREFLRTRPEERSGAVAGVEYRVFGGERFPFRDQAAQVLRAADIAHVPLVVPYPWFAPAFREHPIHVAVERRAVRRQAIVGEQQQVGAPLFVDVAPDLADERVHLLVGVPGDSGGVVEEQ